MGKFVAYHKLKNVFFFFWKRWRFADEIARMQEYVEKVHFLVFSKSLKNTFIRYYILRKIPYHY